MLLTMIISTNNRRWKAGRHTIHIPQQIFRYHGGRVSGWHVDAYGGRRASAQPQPVIRLHMHTCRGSPANGRRRRDWIRDLPLPPADSSPLPRLLASFSSSSSGRRTAGERTAQYV